MKKLREAFEVFLGCLGLLWIGVLVYIAFGWLGAIGGGK